jgi:hypothetical protein
MPCIGRGPVTLSHAQLVTAPVELILLRLGVWRLVDAHAVYDFHDHRDLLSSLRTPSPLPTEEIFLKKNFLEKRDAHVHRLGRKSTQVPLPDKGMGGGGDHLYDFSGSVFNQNEIHVDQPSMDCTALAE